MQHFVCIYPTIFPCSDHAKFMIMAFINNNASPVHQLSAVALKKFPPAIKLLASYICRHMWSCETGWYQHSTIQHYAT